MSTPTAQADRPLSEATFESLHVEQLLVQNPETEEYHPLELTSESGSETVAFNETGQDGEGQQLGRGVCLRYLDLKAANTDDFFRLTIVLVDGVPTLLTEEAPEDSATVPRILADIVSAPLKYILLLDQFSATVKKLSVYNSSMVVADHTFQEPHTANTVAIRDVGDGLVKLLAIYDSAISISDAPMQYATSPDFIRMKDLLTGELRLLRVNNGQIQLGAT